MVADKIMHPLQAFGIGDIIFTQTLLHRLAGSEYKIVWGVERQFADGLNRAYPLVDFVPFRELDIDYSQRLDTESNGRRIVPIRWADSIMGVPYTECMASKYQLYKMTYWGWKEKAGYNRNLVKEQVLYDLVVAGGEPYNLINRTFQSDAAGHVPIAVNNGNSNIYMKPIDGFSLFDWSLIIEQATEVHTVSTSIFYLLELLELAQPLHLYGRPNDKNFTHIDYLFTKPYILHPL